MRRYEITVDGRTFDVRVLGDPMAERVEVDVDGEVLAVEVRRAVDGVPAVPAPAAEERSAPAAARPSAAPAAPVVTAGGASVRAPLPGVIQQVVVKPGQEVQPGETLVVIEAMKMKNAIRATRSGVIEEVYAVEGRQVAHGDELLRYQS